ncbi:MAG: tetratricopeptide repeat protein, partial [Desulfovibrio sp.]|nr:tetratricopeptide repeat protein [Desulfovibrio sp.]
YKLVFLDPARDGEDARPTAGGPVRGQNEFRSLFADFIREKSAFVLSASKPVRERASRQPDFYSIVEDFLKIAASDSPSVAPDLAGTMGRESFVFLHKYKKAEETAEFFAKLVDLTIACGSYEWPFLNFDATGSEARAFQALEYAELLPPPRIGVFDSVALTIGADRKFSMGDAFGAMEDYKLALLASPANAMARNSLGVCLAGLGKFDEAKQFCAEALEYAEDENLRAKIAYNLGSIYDKLNDYKNARKYYKACLKLDSSHVYAGVRLGKMYEARGRIAAARKLYETAAQRAGNSPDLLNLASRCLANLNINMFGSKAGRELLYDNIARDPGDAASLALLAKTYLADREDLNLAELFARKSANILGTSAAWDLLARVLEARNKFAEAERARARARKTGATR